MKQTSAVCAMVPVYLDDKDFLVTGNNDGVILVWELIVTEELQAKPYLLRMIKNSDNPDFDPDDVLASSNV